MHPSHLYWFQVSKLVRRAGGKMIPRISVILPYHNSEKAIAEAIKSILNQTFSNFELLLIADSSTDNSDKIVSSFKDERIRRLENNRSKGVAGARNMGAIYSRGEYIAIMDSDDVCKPNRLELQLKEIEKGFDLVSSSAETIDICGNVLGEMGKEMNDSQIKVALFYGSPIIHPSVLIKAKILKENFYNEDRIRGVDYDLWIRLMDKIKMKTMKEKLIYYRWWEGQLTKTNQEKGLEIFNATKATVNKKIKGIKLLYFLKNYGVSGFWLGVKSEVYRKMFVPMRDKF